MKLFYWLFMMFAVVMFLGCTPEQIETVKTQAEYQLTDPASQIQQAAQAVGTAAEYAKPAAAMFPGSQWIIGGLTVISGICNLLQKLRSNKQQQAIKEIVAGGEAFKDQAAPEAQVVFKQAQAVAQSATTKEIVAVERVRAA